MSGSLQLLVGLSNPGAEYAKTRHNAGAWFVDNVAQAQDVNLRNEAKFHGKHGKFEFQTSQFCHLLIPNTFINESGIAVNACLNYYKIPPEALLVVHDDVDLVPGDIRLKWDGGDGGHNGLKDIIRHLDTKKFYRLRIGVGHPGKSKDVADYVLSPPSKSDRELIHQALQAADEILPLLLKGEFAKAMQALHTVK